MINKIYKYRLLIWDTIYLLIKYSLIRFVLSDKKFLEYLYSQKRPSIENLSSQKASSSQQIRKQLRRFLEIIYPNGNCLVLCLIKRDILNKNGFHEPVLLGVKNTSQGLLAHAWLPYEGITNYKLVYLLP